MPATVDISVVVPVYDEEPSLALLHAEIVQALGSLEAAGRRCEIIFVDDRSSDGSLAVMLELRKRDPRVRVIQFRARSGQTAALAAGFDQARGAIVVTLDGDLQNDPADIPRLIAHLDQGYDVVAGWRKSRQDGFVLRRMPSRIANRLIAWVTGVAIHDTGCTLKAFRRELIEKLPIYAEQHRFLPAMSAGSGARIAEIVVNHRPRRFGRSKYGLGRATRVLLDLLSITMLSSFSQRPLRYFVLLTLPFWALLLLFVVDCITKYDQISFDNNWGQVALLVYLVFFMLCLYFVMLGLLAELAVKASGMHRARVQRILVQVVEHRV
jgi:glycosyltransferase involved in cell wall biosynthesis